MTVQTLPDYTTDQPSAYKAAIDAAFAGNQGAIAGIIESDAAIVDACWVGPAIDGAFWAGRLSLAGVFASRNIAVLKLDGAGNSEVDIWDAGDPATIGGSPLATVALSGATGTSIAGAKGYLIVGTSDQGLHFVDSHGGSWAERTTEWPRRLSTSTTPALTTNNVTGVAAGGLSAPGAPFDPKTGGAMPTFWAAFGDTDVVALIKYDGNVWTRTTVTGSADKVACDRLGNGWWSENGGTNNWVRTNSSRVEAITADDFGIATVFDPDAAATFSGPGGTYAAVDYGKGLLVGASSAGLALMLGVGGGDLPGSNNGHHASAFVTDVFTTGFMGQVTKLAGLANSVTADRSGNSNTLTENGTVPSAVVASGAELTGYTLGETNNVSLAYDADFDFGTGDFYVMLWFKRAANATDRVLFSRDQSPTGGSNIKMIMQSDGKIQNFSTGTGTEKTDQGDLDDDEWHLAMIGRRNGLAVQGADGVVTEGADISATNFDNGTASMTIGADVNGLFDGLDGEVALVRVGDSGLGDDLFRKIYEAERGLFAASAKCLLQGGSEAVLDGRVDPITGRVMVTQSDSQVVFNGLAIDSERTIEAAGTTFEHGLLFDGTIVEINDANAYMSAPAIDARGVADMTKALAAGGFEGVDLSKAKAWAIYTQVSGITIYESHNVESIADTATGRSTITFAVPFKDQYYVAAGSTDAANIFAVNNTNMKRESAEVYVIGHTGAVADSNRISVAFFGELENE